MSAHLIDNAADWAALGTDLLDGAPDSLRDHLTGGRHDPSRQLADITAHGSPLGRMAVTETSASGLDWGYVLHLHGIEVIDLHDHRHGPVVDWSTDPRTRFSDSHARWKPDRPVPATMAPRVTQLGATTAKPTATPLHGHPFAAEGPRRSPARP